MIGTNFVQQAIDIIRIKNSNDKENDNFDKIHTDNTIWVQENIGEKRKKGGGNV